jgi:hypothetical protein
MGWGYNHDEFLMPKTAKNRMNFPRKRIDNHKREY